MKANMRKILMIAAVAALALRSVGAQTPDRAKTLRAAADALGMVRWADIGSGNTRLPGVDVVTTMELWGSGTTYGNGEPYKPNAAWSAVETEYHVALAYNPPAMRVELTRTSPDGRGQGGGGRPVAAPRRTIQTV